MLGIRLSPDMERRLDRHVARTRRNRSDVAREALAQYLDKVESVAELRRQVAVVAAHERVNGDPDEAAFDNWLVRRQLSGGE